VLLTSAAAGAPSHPGPAASLRTGSGPSTLSTGRTGRADTRGMIAGPGRRRPAPARPAVLMAIDSGYPHAGAMVIGDYTPSAVRERDPEPEDPCVPVHGMTLALPDQDRIPAVGELGDGADLAPLGSVDGRPVWVADIATAPPQRWQSLDWAWCAASADPALRQLAGRAIAVAAFRRTHRYCGACGAPNADHPTMAGRSCPACGQFEYVKPIPVALVAVHRTNGGGREILLGRHTYGLTGTWALLGGYLDPAETFEQAAIREVREETGLAVANLRYVGSEAWGALGPGVLLCVFRGEAVDPAAQPTVDGREIAEARWFPVDRLPEQIPPAHTIAGRVIAGRAA
jgi:NAD+ diphosphatase